MNAVERVTLIGLPFYSLAKYRGMGEAVKSLRSLGIAEIVKETSSSFNDLGDCHLSDIVVDTGPSNLRNFTQFLTDSDVVQERVSGVGYDDFVFCLGGECTFIVGTLAGFKSRFKGKPGMLWIDAHGDFNTPETTVSGFIGGMPLAFACGRGPRLSDKIESVKPLLEETNVVHVASRALDPLESQAMSTSPMKLYAASVVHKEGASKVAAEAAAHLADVSDWIICHLDVDSIDPTIMPAVNFPEPNGLSLDEVKILVKALKETGKLKVFDLAAYNPRLDRDGASGNRLLKLVKELF